MMNPPRRTRRSRIAFAAPRLVVAFVLLCSTLALAQDTGDVARRLVGEGIEAARGQDWITAKDRFQRAYDIQPLPLTLYNLAAAQEKTGEYVEADRSYRIFLRETVAGEHDDFRALALKRRSAIKTSICYVVINASNLDPNDRLTVDDREIAHAVLGESIPTNPGSLTVKVERQGRTVAQQVVNLSPGSTKGVTLKLAAPQPTTQNPPPGTAANGGNTGSQTAPQSRASNDSTTTSNGATSPTAGSGTSTAEPSPEDEEGGSVVIPVVVTGAIVAGLVVVAAAAAAGSFGGFYAYVTPARDPTSSTLGSTTLEGR